MPAPLRSRPHVVKLRRAMDGLPLTVRLLDPPLHEFLPHSKEEMQALATTLGKSVQVVEDRVAQLQEVRRRVQYCREMFRCYQYEALAMSWCCNLQTTHVVRKCDLFSTVAAIHHTLESFVVPSFWRAFARVYNLLFLCFCLQPVACLQPSSFARVYNLSMRIFVCTTHCLLLTSKTPG